MDTITQGLLGGVVAQVTAKRKYLRHATFAGFFGGVLSDLDMVIRSRFDPLLSLEYHRHFTHSLLLIPVGGLLAALFYWLIRRRKVPFLPVYWAATIGVATHGILDAFTSYGTLLLWPFSDRRIAFDAMPIIHLFYTVILLIGFLGTYKIVKRWPAVVVLALAILQMGGGWMQRNRALEVQRGLAIERGHALTHGRVLPSIGTMTLWRSLYESDGNIYIDAIWVVPFREGQYWTGGSLKKIDVDQLSKLYRNPVISKNLERYSWFADYYLAYLPNYPSVIGDLRFATVPNSLQPIWGIEIVGEPGKEKIKKRYFRKESRGGLGRWWRMLRGQEK